MALTVLQVEQAGSAKPKALGPGKHHDENGLYLEVRNVTSKSWTGRYTVAGKERWIGVGPVKDIPLKRARELHAENRRLVAEGIDPRERRRQLQAAAAVQAAKTVTFGQIGERHILTNDPSWRNPKHRQQWRNTLKTYVYPVIGQLQMQEIDIARCIGDPMRRREGGRCGAAPVSRSCVYELVRRHRSSRARRTQSAGKSCGHCLA
jgi:hypothetical protein